MIPEKLITQLILSLLVVKTKRDFRSVASIISTFDICYLNREFIFISVAHCFVGLAQYSRKTGSCSLFSVSSVKI